PISLNRTAERETRLVALKGRVLSARSRECIARVQPLIAEVIEDVPAKSIGTALGDDVNNASAGSPKLCVITVAVDLEFADGFLTQGRANAVAGDVVLVHAIDLDAVGTPTLTRKRKTRSLEMWNQDSLDRRTLLDDSGCELCEIEEITPVDRQGTDRFLGDGRSLMRSLGLNQGRGGFDDLRLIRDTHDQMAVDHSRLADRQHNAAFGLWVETLRLDTHLVFTRRQQRDAVATG